jgi:hypothetical protein
MPRGEILVPGLTKHCPRADNELVHISSLSTATTLPGTRRLLNPFYKNKAHQSKGQRLYVRSQPRTQNIQDSVGELKVQSFPLTVIMNLFNHKFTHGRLKQKFPGLILGVSDFRRSGQVLISIGTPLSKSHDQTCLGKYILLYFF